MADETTEEEPSIEEILDSIRQIISDDDEDAPTGDAPEASEAPAAEEDVIELTDPVEDTQPEPEPEPTPEPEPEVAAPEEEDDVFNLDIPDSEPEPEPEPEPTPEPEPIQEPIAEEPALQEEGDILTGIAESAAIDGFEKLVRKTAVEYNGITLEEIVRTELKPLLREWLDDNLPSMIERLVQEELERVSKRVLGDN